MRGLAWVGGSLCYGWEWKVISGSYAGAAIPLLQQHPAKEKEEEKKGRRKVGREGKKYRKVDPDG